MYNFLKPIPVMEETIKVLKDMGIDLVENPPPLLFHVEQISVEPMKRHCGSLVFMELKYGENK
jgi:hypothetical protein